MRGEEKYSELQRSAAQHVVARIGLNEGTEAHERSSATTRGGEYSGSALRGHWNNTRTADKNDYCNGAEEHHTYYRGDGGYGYYNSNGDYTGVEPDYYGNDSCGYNVHDANDEYDRYYHSEDGYGNYNSEGEYACANINNYYDGSCEYTGYEEEYGCYTNNYGGNHCETEYGGYYNEYVGAETDGYEKNYPPTGEDEMCCIAEHTLNMATVLKENVKEKEKQMKLAKVTKRMDEVTKAFKHLAEKQGSPQLVEAIRHLTTEKEEMAGILECPAKQQRTLERLANNRFAALSEEEEEDHGGRPTMTDMCATNRHVAINFDNIMARGTRMNEDDDVSVGTTQSADTVKISNH